MRIGFITNNLAVSGWNDIAVLARWAAENGFDDMELGPSIPLDVDKTIRASEETGLFPSGLIYCRNMLDPEQGQQHQAALRERIRFAHEIGARRVTCSTGSNGKTIVEGNILRYDPEGCLEDVVRVYTPLLEYAQSLHVDLCFEMCPMVSNIAISPYMWDRLFEKLDAPNLGLVYDPSHLVWEMMDPYAVIPLLGKRIFHVHGKDCVIDGDKLKETGILHLAHQLTEQVNTGEGIHTYKPTWWTYRLAGLGSLSWEKIVTRLKEIDYQGTISIEHEDPVYSGSLDRVKEGILLARNHIEQFL